MRLVLLDLLRTVKIPNTEEVKRIRRPSQFDKRRLTNIKMAITDIVKIR